MDALEPLDRVMLANGMAPEDWGTVHSIREDGMVLVEWDDNVGHLDAYKPEELLAV